MLKDTPIRRKLMGVIMLTCSVALVLMCSAYIFFEFFSFRNTIRNNVSTLGGIIASNSSAALAFDSEKDANEILAALRADQHIAAACLYDKDGKIFAKYPKKIAASELPGSPQTSGYQFEGKFFIGFQPVIQQNEQLGTLYIKSDTSTMYDQLKHILSITCLLIAGSLFIAYLLSNLLQRTISGPVLSLEQAARMVTKDKNYSIRAVKMGEDEMGLLTDTFNHMLAQIEKQNIEIKQAEEASSKLAAIVESSDDAIIGQTLDGMITSWNNAAERMFGYSADEAIGNDISILIPEVLHGQGQLIAEHLRKGLMVENFETQLRTRQLGLLHVSLTVSQVRDAGGNVSGQSIIARDITEKKQEELRKNDFIAIVSHELKTPLTSLKSYLQILLAGARKQEAEFTINALTRAENQVKKMTNMIQDFLNLARLEGGNILLNKEPIALQPLIEEVITETQFLTSMHTVKTNTCTDVRIIADREKIGQVLINLLGNAVKYSPDGGTIVINCEQIDQRVRISVIDEGVGINPADQKKLFSRFYRVKNEKVKNVSGFGIGLYLVSEIVRLHDSTIKVESKEGKGSTFYFDLDIA